MEWYRITSLHAGTVDVQAHNWLAALGQGLGQLGLVNDLTRIACETLPGGRILVRDARTGAGYSVVAFGPEEEPEHTEEVELAPLAADDITVSVGVEDYANAVAAAADAGEAIERALGGLRHLAPSTSGAVLRRHTDGWLAFEGAFGPGAERLAGLVIPPGTGVAGFAVDRTLAVVLRDAYTDRRFFRQLDSVTGITTRSLLCIPVALEGTVYGCIELVNAVDAAGFSRDAVADADIIAGALAERLAQEPIPSPPTAR